MIKTVYLAFLFIFGIAVYGSHAGTQTVPEITRKHSNIKTEQPAGSLSGKVVESMNSGSYTYVNIEKDKKKTWVAIPKTDVKVGQEMSFYPGQVMLNFESKTLNRTFDAIIFSPGPVNQRDVQAVQDPHARKSSVSAVKEKITVDKASGENAYTVAELYEKKSVLNKKNIVVKGKVVKVTANIMETNWIHIQDGSGNPKDRNHDLIVTSVDLPSVGDVVTASGTLINDKDIGRGYKFDLILEKAKIKK
jgi:hypothetical protein